MKQQSRHITHPFSEPYFIQTDSAGLIIATCERFAQILSRSGIDDYLRKDIFSVFSRIQKQPVEVSPDHSHKYPSVVDLKIHSPKINIRWISSELPSGPQRKKRWQWTGIQIVSSRKNRQELSRNAVQSQKEKTLSDTIINSMPGIFYLFDHKGKFLRWNKRFETISGFSADEIIRMHPVDFFSGREKSYISSRIEKVLTEGVSDAEANLLTRNKKEIPHYFTGQLVALDNTACVAGVGIDISELRKAEQLLALEKKVLKINSSQNTSLPETIDCFLLGIEKIYPDMRCSVLTLAEDGISLKTLSAPSLPMDYTSRINGLHIGPCCGSCGTAMHLKKRVIVHDIANDPLWDNYKTLALSFDLQACWSIPVLDAQGDVLACFATYYRHPKKPTREEMAIVDRAVELIKIIIENKKAEEKIRLSNERYMLATRATNDAIWDWDMKSGKYFWGEGLYTRFGYTPGQETGDPVFWENNIHAADRERILASRQLFIMESSESVWAEEYRFRKTDGKYAIVSDRAFLVFDVDKNIVRVVGSMQDITDKKNMEKQLLMQELNKQKLIAQAMINAQEKERAEIGQELHDNVNQILSTGKLYVELAKTNENERKQLLESCSENINTAINEIRKISRALVPSSIEDLGLLDSISDLVEHVKATKNINVEFYPVSWFDEHIGSSQKLTLFRIIQEQVSNVLKHSNADNLIIELEMDECENAVKLSIVDDGRGFDPEKIKTKKSLGLSNIMSRANLFDGKIAIISAPEKGCRLNVQLPIHNTHLNKLYE